MVFRTGRALACLAFVLGGVGASRAQAPAWVSGIGETVTGTGERARLIVVRSVLLRADGSVTGELEFDQYVRSPSTGAAVHYVTRERVLCVALQGHSAWVGTVVTASTNPDFPPGATQAVWYFEDNGGGTEHPDRINSLHAGAETAALCGDADAQAVAADTSSPLTLGHLEVHAGS
jgi:hypothetical protein